MKFHSLYAVPLCGARSTHYSLEFRLDYEFRGPRPSNGRTSLMPLKAILSSDPFRPAVRVTGPERVKSQP